MLRIGPTYVAFRLGTTHADKYIIILLRPLAD